MDDALNGQLLPLPFGNVQRALIDFFKPTKMPIPICGVIADYLQTDVIFIPSKSEVSFFNVTIRPEWGIEIVILKAVVDKINVSSNSQIVPKLSRWLCNVLTPDEVSNLFDYEIVQIFCVPWRIELKIQLSDDVEKVGEHELYKVSPNSFAESLISPESQIVKCWFMKLHRAKYKPDPYTKYLKEHLKEQFQTWRLVKSSFCQLVRSFPFQHRFCPTEAEYVQMLMFANSQRIYDKSPPKRRKTS
jgi:hypothetical protein